MVSGEALRQLQRSQHALRRRACFPFSFCGRSPVGSTKRRWSNFFPCFVWGREVGNSSVVLGSCHSILPENLPYAGSTQASLSPSLPSHLGALGNQPSLRSLRLPTPVPETYLLPSLTYYPPLTLDLPSTNRTYLLRSLQLPSTNRKPTVWQATPGPPKLCQETAPPPPPSWERGSSLRLTEHNAAGQGLAMLTVWALDVLLSSSGLKLRSR